MPAIKAFVFDAYSTLFDVHSIGVLAEQLYPGNGSALSRLWRTKQLEYTWLRSLMGRYEDFAAVTRAGLQAACQVLQLPLDGAGTAQLMAAYDHLTLHPDARQALSALTHHKLAILSNGAPAMLEAVVDNAGLHETFFAVISADEVGIFKPAPEVYQLAPDRLGIAKSEIGFVSSNYWDAAGASNFGFHVFWINRAGAPPDRLGAEPHQVLQKLTELSAIVGS